LIFDAKRGPDPIEKLQRRRGVHHDLLATAKGDVAESATSSQVSEKTEIAQMPAKQAKREKQQAQLRRTQQGEQNATLDVTPKGCVALRRESAIRTQRRVGARAIDHASRASHFTMAMVRLQTNQEAAQIRLTSCPGKSYDASAGRAPLHHGTEAK
jgi:hypothetical protein